MYLNNPYESTEIQSFYKIIHVMNSFDVKYKIKGNVLLHFIQHTMENDKYFRGTKDIDVATEYSEVIKLKKSIELIFPMCEIQSTNSGLIKRIKNLNQSNLTQMDIQSVDKLDLNNKYTKLYTIKDQKFYGNSIEGILKDKIASISSITVSRRFKDVIDLFIVKKLVNMSDDEFKSKLKLYKTGNFEQYFKRETINAKEQFIGLNSKNQVTIDEIYNKISKLIIESNKEDLKWI